MRSMSRELLLTKRHKDLRPLVPKTVCLMGIMCTPFKTTAVTRASLYSVCLEEVKRSDDGSNRGSDEAAPSPREDEPTADGKMPPSKPDSSKHMPVCLL